MTLLSAAMAPRMLTRSDAWTWRLACFGLCTVLLAPLLIVDVPPLTDYPNHLARAFVLASLPQDPVLARFYAPHWSVIPNLAVDLVGPPFMHVLPVHVVGRLLIAAALLLPVLGAIAYHSILSPLRDGRWWSLGAGLAAYNSCLMSGFLNFTISLGLALLLSAGWLRWREDRPIVAIGLAVAGAPLLFVCHLMGLLFFTVLISSAELSRLLRLRNPEVLPAALGRAVVLLVVVAAPLALYAASDLQPLGGDAEFVGLGEKLSQLAGVFSNYDMVLDVAAVLVAVGLPAIGLIGRKGTMPAPAAIAISILLILYFVAPSAWKSTYALDIRFGVMLGFMAFAGFVPARLPATYSNVLAGGIGLLFLARMALLTTAWAAHNIDLADVRRVLQPVQPGQAVYVAAAAINESPEYWKSNPGWRRSSDGSRLDEHIGALVLIERRAYWPFEFDIPSQQPIETREPYRALAGRVGHLPNRAEAAVADLCGFDYALLLEADSVPDLPVARFRLLIRSGFAALYGITNCKAER